MDDLLALAKPRIVVFCVLMLWGGLWLGLENHHASLWLFLWATAGTASLVGSANTFNMIYERKTDALMSRTKDRPLVQGRVSLQIAWLWAVFLALLGTLCLAFGTNFATLVVGLAALFLYTMVYTPLKFKTPLALVIGALPGAAPPLMGWSAVTGHLDWPGIALFTILFTWQMPHFLAIATTHKGDYQRAGIRVVPWVRGEPIARAQGFFWSLALFAATLWPYALHVVGPLYFWGALLLGLWFLWLNSLGLQSWVKPTWARQVFFASLFYLPAVIALFVMDYFLTLFTPF